MTDQQQFEDMMTRNGIVTRKVEDQDEPTLVVVSIERGDKVNTFSHCFCEFRFHADGSLAQVSFGY